MPAIPSTRWPLSRTSRCCQGRQRIGTIRGQYRAHGDRLDSHAHGEAYGPCTARGGLSRGHVRGHHLAAWRARPALHRTRTSTLGIERPTLTLCGGLREGRPSHWSVPIPDFGATA
jgi:hypothetical protein